MPEIGSDDAPDASTRVLCTRDHAVIKQWAQARRAEPATGEATSTGPATPMVVNDSGAGMRFNFPGASRFRPITWDEWFELFDHHELAFVYDNEVAAAGATAGAAATSAPSPRYQIVKFADWKGAIG